MPRHPFLVVLTLITGLILQAGSFASESREITWDDLVPPEAEFDDPFTLLDEDQLYELSLVVEIRVRLESGKNVDEETLAEHEQRLADLAEQEVDVDGLIAMHEDVVKERIAKTFMTNPDLNGRTVRMPGYLLPLEFDGERVTDFFLVPWVGACIHTPPPPPNQIVHVTTDEGFANTGSLYTPVWVDGLLKTEQLQSNLNFVDGAADIPSAYVIDASSVKPYE
ncbi:MAG: DUF3299 domain-containing protein [Gammaproteobacteria bacterium]|nr:DUF3299 domain-containing protein [Gammaproteobacteria bacterium]